MGRHKECLREICRLCSFPRAVQTDRQPVKKEQLSKIIQAAFGLDVRGDSEDVHPPFICKLCHLKLKKWWAKAQKKQRANLTIELTTFVEASCEKCSASKPSVFSEHVGEWAAMAQRFGCATWQGENLLQIMKMSAEGLPVAFLTIHEDFTWQLVVSRVPVPLESHLTQGVGENLTVEHLEVLLKRVSSLFVCEGNQDFEELIEIKKGEEGQVPIQITANDSYDGVTVRHKKCLLLVEKKTRCEVCQIYRADLNALLGQQKAKKNQVISTSSKIPNSSLTKKQLKTKVALLQTERRGLKRRAVSLTEKIASMLREESIGVDSIQDGGLLSTMVDCDAEMRTVLGTETPARLLWEQQKESALKGKQMRWHPAIIRWCIALQSRSSSAYNLIRQTGFIRLPHPSTLHPYSHFANPTTGFNFDMLERIVKDYKIDQCPERESNICLLFDEMKVKAGLVFSVRSGKVIGFTDVGTVANELAEFERKCRGDNEPEIASHVMVLMVRGIFSRLHAPVGYYPTVGITSHQLYPCLWEAALYLELAGFKVRAFTSDGASPNRKFYRLHEDSSTTADVTFCTGNPMDSQRKIFFFCDVPHLVKTTRNNLENSGYNNKTRELFYNKQEIKWTQLLQLYEWDIGLDRHSPGLRRLHKITYEHLHLTPSLRMRVYMAAQVLSSTVANALESFGKSGTSSTIKFLRFFDQFFDCLNVSNSHKGNRLRKPALDPYKRSDDWRFEWLLKEFLGFLKEWEEEVQNLKDIDKALQKKMCLSKETTDGIKITVHSFVELGKLLLDLPGVEFLLSEKFNQDPLEEYFSKQRGAGGANDNPTAEQFAHNMLSLYVASDCAKASKRGNCRLQDRDQGECSIDNTPLPRRK